MSIWHDRADSLAALDRLRVPEHVRSGLLAYLEDRRPVGSFLTAVMENNLREAVMRADEVNRRELWRIVAWLWDHAPTLAWGSPERVDAWLAEQAVEDD